MAKSQDAKKNVKKEALKSAKEKKAEKREKKAKRGQYFYAKLNGFEIMKCFNRLEKQIASLKLLLVFALFLFFSCSIKDPPKPNIIFNIKQYEQSTIF